MNMLERLRFEHEINALGLREYEEGEPGEKAREVVVGQKIVLDLNKLGFAGGEIEAVHWSVPRGTVAKYWGDRKGSGITKLSDKDLTKNPLVFYWTDAGDGKSITYMAAGRRGDTELRKNSSVTFNVKAPVVDRFLYKLGKPGLLKEKGLPVMRFGKLNKEAAGIKWDWQVTMPKNFGGSLKDLQTILIKQSKVQLLNSKSGKTRRMERRHPTKTQHEQLDQDVTDAGTEATYSAKGHYVPIEFPTKVAAGQSFANKVTWDSPGTLLEASDVSSSVDNKYKYYILYKPDQPESVWVPLAKVEWLWKMEAIKRGREWMIKPGTKPQGEVGHKENPTQDFPAYFSNKNASDWIEEQ